MGLSAMGYATLAPTHLCESRFNEAREAIQRDVGIVPIESEAFWDIIILGMRTLGNDILTHMADYIEENHTKFITQIHTPDGKNKILQIIVLT